MFGYYKTEKMAELYLCNDFWCDSSDCGHYGKTVGKLCLHGDGRSVERWPGADAVKYTRNGGKISIYMKETFNSADRILVIEDNGIGITKEDIPRIFERGYTGYNGRMSKKSSGIGLYLCRKAADKLGISIAIESKLDKGTKVLLDMAQKYISHE